MLLLPHNGRNVFFFCVRCTCRSLHGYIERQKTIPNVLNIISRVACFLGAYLEMWTMCTLFMCALKHALTDL